MVKKNQKYQKQILSNFVKNRATRCYSIVLKQTKLYFDDIIDVHCVHFVYKRGKLIALAINAYTKAHICISVI